MLKHKILKIISITIILSLVVIPGLSGAYAAENTWIVSNEKSDPDNYMINWSDIGKAFGRTAPFDRNYIMSGDVIKITAQPKEPVSMEVSFGVTRLKIIGMDDAALNVRIRVQSSNPVLTLQSINLSPGHAQNNYGVLFNNAGGTNTLNISGKVSITRSYPGIESRSALSINKTGNNDILTVQAGDSSSGDRIGIKALGDLIINVSLDSAGGDSVGSGFAGGAGLYSEGGITVNAAVAAVGGRAGMNGAGGEGIFATGDIVINTKTVAQGGASIGGGGGVGIWSTSGDIWVYDHLAAIGGDSGAPNSTCGVPVYFNEPEYQQVILMKEGTLVELRDGGSAIKSSQHDYLRIKNDQNLSGINLVIQPSDAVSKDMGGIIEVKTSRSGVTVSLPSKRPDQAKIINNESSIQYAIDENNMAVVQLSEADVVLELEKETDKFIINLISLANTNGLKLTLNPLWFDNVQKPLLIKLADRTTVEFSTDVLKEFADLASGESIQLELRSGSSLYFSIASHERNLSWYSLKNPVIINLPYVPHEDLYYTVNGIDGIVAVKVAETGETDFLPRSGYRNDAVWAKVFSTGTYAAAVMKPVNYRDVDNQELKKATNYLSTRGVVAGMGENIFGTYNTVTRAQFINFLMRMSGVEPQDAWRPASFQDQGEIPDWARGSIMQAAAMGIIAGDGQGYYNPNATITRQDMLTMTYRAMGIFNMLPETFSLQWMEYTDWDQVSDYAAEAIQNLTKLKLVSGKGDGRLGPLEMATRAETAQLLYNILIRDLE